MVQHIRSYPGFQDIWEISTFHDGNAFTQISSTEILRNIRALVSLIGKDELGFTADEVGTHSVRSSLAMMMYLTPEIPTYTIMLVGCWNFAAFLAYIEQQVK